MRFDEPHPSTERNSPTRLSTSGQGDRVNPPASNMYGAFVVKTCTSAPWCIALFIYPSVRN
jgi:hypothetical protein